MAIRERERERERGASVFLFPSPLTLFVGAHGQLRDALRQDQQAQCAKEQHKAVEVAVVAGADAVANPAAGIAITIWSGVMRAGRTGRKNPKTYGQWWSKPSVFQAGVERDNKK